MTDSPDAADQYGADGFACGLEAAEDSWLDDLATVLGVRYPTREAALEAIKRTIGARSRDDISDAAFAHLDKMATQPDGMVNGYPYWHGWAIRDAFIAGWLQSTGERT